MQLRHVLGTALAVLLTVAAFPAAGQVIRTFDRDAQGLGGAGPVGDPNVGWSKGELVITQKEPNPDKYDPNIYDWGSGTDGDVNKYFAMKATVTGAPEGKFPFGLFWFRPDWSAVGQTTIELTEGTAIYRVDLSTAPHGGDIENPLPYGGAIGFFRLDTPDLYPGLGDTETYEDFKDTELRIDWYTVTDDPDYVPTQLDPPNFEKTFDCDQDGSVTWMNPVSWEYYNGSGHLRIDRASEDPNTWWMDTWIDGGVQHYLSIRATVEGAPESGLPMAVFWQNPGWGQTRVHLQNGTHTYFLDLDGAPHEGNIDGPSPWGGDVGTIRIDAPDLYFGEGEPDADSGLSWADFDNAVVHLDWLCITDTPNYEPVQDTQDCNAYVGDDKVWFLPFASAPTVDGDPADAQWADLPWYWVGTLNADQETPPESNEDLSARFKTGFFGNDMFLLVEVTDDTDSLDGTYPWDRDSIELFLDVSRIGGDLDTTGEGTAQAEAWRADGGPSQIRLRFDGNQTVQGRHFRWEEAVLDSDGEYATTNPAGKTIYEIQMKVPPEAKGINIADVRSFGFGLQVNDADGLTRDMVINWQGTNVAAITGPDDYVDAPADTPRMDVSANSNGEGGFAVSADDYDGDGLFNDEEDAAGSDPGVVDTDGDGLTDEEEVNYDSSGGQGVYTPGSDTDPTNWDTDGDEISDADEIANGTDPLTPDFSGELPVSLAGLVLAVGAAGLWRTRRTR